MKVVNQMVIKILKNIRDRLHGSICYYQGLNYFVAYMLFILKDELLVYRLSLSLLTRYMCLFVNEDLGQIKLAFYILTRLLQINLPELSDRLRLEKVTVDIFSTPWFLTLFSTVAQSDPNSQTLLHIWDIFIAGGWVEFFKVIIAVMKSRAKVVQISNYEEIMMIFFNIGKSEIFRTGSSQQHLTESFKAENYSLEQQAKDTNTGGKAMQNDVLSDDGSDESCDDPFDIKSEICRVPMDQFLFETLITEYKKVASQIVEFWSNYE